MTRVFITGLGVVSPVGGSVTDYWRSMLERSIAPSQGFGEFSDRIDNRYMYTCHESVSFEAPCGRTEALALDAVEQAIGDARLGEISLLRGGIALGTTMGDESLLETARAKFGDPDSLRSDFPFQVTATLAQKFGLCGPNVTISNACTSGLYGIDLAASAIRQGEADLMIAGGVESASRIVLSCFNRLGALDDELCRPFDVDRKGTVLGEGAAFVVLESEEHMRRRGKKDAYCEYKGSGWSCDAHQPTAPEPSGEQIERALRESLVSSGIVPDQVDCILPHGTGTPLNDTVEAAVLTRVFGNNMNPPVLTAIKSKLGHSGGASGAFSVVTACLILKHARVPATANLKTRDKAFSLPIPMDVPLNQEIKTILVNAYAFGGNNISVTLSRQ